MVTADVLALTTNADTQAAASTPPAALRPGPAAAAAPEACAVLAISPRPRRRPRPSRARRERFARPGPPCTPSAPPLRETLAARSQRGQAEASSGTGDQTAAGRLLRPAWAPHGDG